ncbi:uncharacterized protein LOC131676049 [Topomyia yanbarensis]|uniref:uncharacterized protein LOC131676049 n=1 Tax=Topomyia yanbarensis TaxID=2498891 RepID=UPI00273C037E|nr:uncharacterized protein LOC131676049 [Topomyia yanbarensis]
MSSNNYAIVQTTENDDVLLSVVPSRWVLKNGWSKDLPGLGTDLCYWPKGVAGYRLLEKAKKDPQIPPDVNVLSAYRCKIKRNNFASYAEAFRELQIMEIHSDTDEYEPRKKLKKSSTAAELFKQIQTKPSSSCSNTATDFADDTRDGHTDNTANPDDSFLEPCPNDIVMTSRSLSLSETTSHESGSKTPMIQSTDTDESTMRQLIISLHNKIDKNAKQIESLNQSHIRYGALLSQVNAKLDVIATKIPSEFVHVKTESYESKKIPLTPVKSLDDMESLEKQSKNDQFVQSVVQFLGSMHGKHRTYGEGATVCLQVINYFFEREFLMKCSWSGISRNKKDNENIISKIPFHKFGGVIDLFHKVVLFSDPSFSKVQCEQFLHRCLRNAKQRYEDIKGIRATASRRRCKRNEPQSNQAIQQGIEEEAEVILEEYLIEVESASTSASPNQTVEDVGGVLPFYA